MKLKSQLPFSKLSQRDYQVQIDNLTKTLRDFVETQVSGFDTTPEIAKQRRNKAKIDFQFFFKTYMPHYAGESNSLLHNWLFENLPAKVKGDGKKIVIAAPRGEAKSTIVTQAFTLWAIITGKKRYVPIIMDAKHQAITMLAALKAEIEGNVRLKMDFPGSTGSGPVWQMDTIITTNNAKVQAIGSGQRIRGLRHGPNRPDLIILDDLENDNNVRSLIQRDRLEEWIQKSVLNLGPPNGTLDVVMIGTVLNSDSVLNRIMKNSMWEAHKFQAILNWPDNIYLWEEWEEIIKAKGEMQASEFYLRFKKEMDVGAIVSWPEVRTLEKLMQIRVSIGEDAFDAEMQNNPAKQNAIFKSFTFWTEPENNWLIYAACDPSMGRSGKGDPSAILIAGYDKATGILNIIEADIRKRPPDQIINDVIMYQKKYNPRLWFFETIQFQEYLMEQVIQQSLRCGVPVPAQGVKPTTDKMLRIEGIQPYVNRGTIKFLSSQHELLRQLKHFGDPGISDDGPDCLEMMWKGILKQNAQLGEIRSIGQRMEMIGKTEITGKGFGTVAGMTDFSNF